MPLGDQAAIFTYRDASVMNSLPLFYHRPLEVIKNAFHEASAESFHFTPFEQHYRSTSAAPQRRSTHIFRNLPPVMIEEHNRMRPAAPSRVREGAPWRLVAVIMLDGFGRRLGLYHLFNVARLSIASQGHTILC
jgi:hypothetical protein